MSAFGAAKTVGTCKHLFKNTPNWHKHDWKTSRCPLKSTGFITAKTAGKCPDISLKMLAFAATNMTGKCPDATLKILCFVAAQSSRTFPMSC